MRPGTRVLLVEDDRSIAGFVEPELVVLDIMLPGLYGVALLKRLRQGGSRVPVVMLTARDATMDKSTASTSAPTTT